MLLLVQIEGCKKEEEKKAPTCKIISPADGQEIVRGDTVTILLDAEDTDGTIADWTLQINEFEIEGLTPQYLNYTWITTNMSKGGHAIKAMVSDNHGLTSSDEITITIVPSAIKPLRGAEALISDAQTEKVVYPGNLPEAAFEAVDTSGIAPYLVSFLNLSSDYSIGPTTWYWDFGDGTTSTEEHPVHEYSSIGVFSVSLIVSNNIGSDTSTIERYIISRSPALSCPGAPTVTDADGNVYNTVVIGNQCWMKENLNVGVMITDPNVQEENGVIEKYCYNGLPENCDKYGGLYNWKEMMQYNDTPGVQGICPVGWHVPTDEEWKILEGEVDNELDYPNPDWDYAYSSRGTDAGLMLKAEEGWNLWESAGITGNGLDLYGFKALPGGASLNAHTYTLEGYSAFWWTSTDRFRREVIHRADYIGRLPVVWYAGNSVRCLKDSFN